MKDVPQLPATMVVAGRFTDGFMRDDLRGLSQFVRVIPFELDLWQQRRTGMLWARLRMVRNLLKFLYYVWRLDIKIIIFWFADGERTLMMAKLSQWLGRKTVLITGGGDAVYLPELQWGRLGSQENQKTFAALIQLVDTVLPFSNSARDQITAQYQPQHIRTIYPAIDVEFFTPKLEAIQPRVVTCAYEYGEPEIMQKGLDTFVQAAYYLPDVQFVVVGNAVGARAERFQRQAPANVTFMPRIPSRAEYRDFLQGSSVYAQLSAHEGFGVSLAEGMACGCIPVVTDRYSLPEVAGDCGWVIPYGPGSAEKAAQAIQSALTSDKAKRQRAREWVLKQFTKDLRTCQFREELGRLVPSIATPPVRVELGCGSTGVPLTIGVDLRMTRRTQAVCDVRHSCFASGSADEVYSFCVLEHLDNPYELLDEVTRVLKPSGTAFLRVPNLGTFSSHLDTTHRFLADLNLWKIMMQGYFEEVEVVPVGTKYRDNRLLVAINELLINVFKFYELTQGWTFICRRKRATPIHNYTGWWQE